IKKLIGTSGAVQYYEVEKGAIRRFAAAVDDPNPLYQDEEYARKSQYGGIIAPPGFFGWPQKHARGSPLAVDIPQELETAFKKAGYPLSLVLDGGMEYEFFLPVHAGDILSAVTTVRNLRERTGETGSIIVSFLDTVYHNQAGELVAKQQLMFVRRSLNLPPQEAAHA
ncbi:MAG: MaoC family dehydratase N-terminal domain-containing protein, partial [Dehalococcoidales bacterium]